MRPIYFSGYFNGGRKMDSIDHVQALTGNPDCNLIVNLMNYTKDGVIDYDSIEEKIAEYISEFPFKIPLRLLEKAFMCAMKTLTSRSPHYCPYYYELYRGITTLPSYRFALLFMRDFNLSWPHRKQEKFIHMLTTECQDSLNNEEELFSNLCNIFLNDTFTTNLYACLHSMFRNVCVLKDAMCKM